MAPNPGRDVHTPIAATILAVGVALLAFMVTVEGEPGALPLALTLVGATWLAWARHRGGRREDDGGR